MANVEELRKKCNQMCEQQVLEKEHLDQMRYEEIKFILCDWLDLFISDHHAWRAVIGNKRCCPIPISNYFSKRDRLSAPYLKFRETRTSKWDFLWPDLPDEKICQAIQDLGFVIIQPTSSSIPHATVDNIALVVPPSEKDKPLTFAQTWVQMINHRYSEYIAAERKKAKYCYRDFLLQLCDVPDESIVICDDYALFKDFKFKPKMSLRCANYIRAMMHKDGLKELYENDEYKGIRLFYELLQP